MRFVSQVQRWTHNLMGTACRPLATATAVGGATAGVGALTGIGVIKHPATIIGTAVVTTAASEAVLWGFGRDPEIQAAEISRRTERLGKKLKKDGNKETNKRVIEALLKGIDVLPDYESPSLREAVG